MSTRHTRPEEIKWAQAAKTNLPFPIDQLPVFAFVRFFILVNRYCVLQNHQRCQHLQTIIAQGFRMRTASMLFLTYYICMYKWSIQCNNQVYFSFLSFTGNTRKYLVTFCDHFKSNQIYVVVNGNKQYYSINFVTNTEDYWRYPVLVD